MSKNLKTTAFVRVTAGQKSKGHTAVQKINYVMREGAFKHKPGLVSFGKGHLPKGFENHHQYWKMTDKHERANSVSFREFMIDLPDHLPLDEVIELAEDMAEELSRNPENNALLTYQYAVHANEKGYGRHMHLVMSEREQDSFERAPELFFKRQNKSKPESGGAPKLTNTASSLKKRTELVKEFVANVINATLEDFNLPMRVDFDINKKKGKQPQIKLTPKEWGVMKSGKYQLGTSKRIDEFIAIDEHNLMIDQLHEQQKILDGEIAIAEAEAEAQKAQKAQAQKPTQQTQQQPEFVLHDEDEDALAANLRMLAEIEAEYAREDAEAARQAQNSTTHGFERKNDLEL